MLRIEADSQGKTRINELSPSRQDSYTFAGTDVSEAMCHEIFDWLFTSGTYVLQMKELAKHVLGRICEYAQWCARPIQSAYLLDDGARVECLDDFRLPEYAPKYQGYLCGVQHLLGQVIRECTDFITGNDAEFENRLEKLVETLREMRKHSKGDWMVID
jgi:hypothetical protein